MLALTFGFALAWTPTSPLVSVTPRCSFIALSELQREDPAFDTLCEAYATVLADLSAAEAMAEEFGRAAAVAKAEAAQTATLVQQLRAENDALREQLSRYQPVPSPPPQPIAGPPSQPTAYNAASPHVDDLSSRFGSAIRAVWSAPISGYQAPAASAYGVPPVGAAPSAPTAPIDVASDIPSDEDLRLYSNLPASLQADAARLYARSRLGPTAMDRKVAARSQAGLTSGGATSDYYKKWSAGGKKKERTLTNADFYYQQWADENRASNEKEKKTVETESEE